MVKCYNIYFLYYIKLTFLSYLHPKTYIILILINNNNNIFVNNKTYEKCTLLSSCVANSEQKYTGVKCSKDTLETMDLNKLSKMFQKSRITWITETGYCP